MGKIENPLVSIIVITYNSSKYVLETLESAKAQTYNNIELIVSDDCSTDNTVEICKNWIEKNKERFVRTELLTYKKNTGIAPNCNRGLNSAQGDWVKYIAGDDILLPYCIESFIVQTKKNKALFHFSLMQYSQKSEYFSNLFLKSFELFQMNTNQIKFLLQHNCLPAPASFIHTETLLKLNGFDERFTMLEDYPLWIKAQRKGYKFNCFMDETVIYRIHNDAVTSNKNKKHPDNRLIKSQMKFNLYILLLLQIKFLRIRNSISTTRLLFKYYFRKLCI